MLSRLSGISWAGFRLTVLGCCCWPGSCCFAQEPTAVLKVQGGQVYDVTFSPDGKTLAAACNDGSVELWDLLTSKRRTTLRGHAWPVGVVAFSPDGKLLATGAMDGTLKLWNLAAGKEKAALIERTDEVNSFNLRTVNSLAFSPDGK